jgi:hypothetical protein
LLHSRESTYVLWVLGTGTQLPVREILADEGRGLLSNERNWARFSFGWPFFGVRKAAFVGQASSPPPCPDAVRRLLSVLAARSFFRDEADLEQPAGPRAAFFL